MAQIGPRLWEADCHDCGHTLSRCTCAWRAEARRILNRRLVDAVMGREPPLDMTPALP